MNRNKTAFTVVELVVSIVIMLILSSITFVSLISYNKNARDSVRISDISNLNDALELYYTDLGSLPDPDNGVSINYLGAEVWKQGTTGEDFTRRLNLIDKVLKDPKSDYEYTYSRLNNKKEFQLSSILESEPISYFKLNINKNFINTTYAAENNNAYAYVKGTYNKQVAEVSTGGIDYILALPSIISSDLSKTDVLEQFSQNKLVYNGFNNLPYSYSGSEFETDYGFSFGMIDIVAYSGSIQNLKNYPQERLQLASNLKKVYSNSSIYNEKEYDFLKETEINLSLPNKKALTLSDNIVKRLGYMIRNLTQVVAVDPEGPPTVWGDIPNNLTLMFATGSIYVDTWNTNTCDTESMNIVDISPGTNTLSLTLLENTIYKLTDGDYITTSSNGINLANCSAIISEGVTNLYSSVEIGSSTDGLIKGNNKSNIIVYGINLDSHNNGAGGTHTKSENGIYLFNLDNSTIGNITVSNSDQDGLNINNSDQNLFKDILSFDNGDDGIIIRDSVRNIFSDLIVYDIGDEGISLQNSTDENIFTNLRIYNSGEEGLYLNGGPSNNNFTDVVSFNNQDGIEINSGNNNTFSSITSSGNTANGIILSGNSSQNNFASMTILGNNANGITITGDTVDQNIINNSIIFNNGSDGIEINNGDDNLFTNIRTYNNGDNGIYLQNNSDNDTFNNIVSFNNGVNGIYFEDDTSNYNIVNNSVYFNNNQRGLYIYNSKHNVINNCIFYKNMRGYEDYSNSSTNKINNINSFFNTSYGIRGKSGAAHHIKYFGNLNSFSNLNNLSNADAGSEISPFFLSGISSTTGVPFGDGIIIKPDLGSWDINNIGKNTSITFDGTEIYEYGVNLLNQSQPLRYNSTTLEFYGTDGNDYNSSKKIGEW